MTSIASQSEILRHFQSMSPLGETQIDELIALRDPLFAEAEAKSHLGWRAVGGEVRKMRLTLTPESLRYFATHAFGGIGFEAFHDFMTGTNSPLFLGGKLTFSAEQLDLHHAATKKYVMGQRDWISPLVGPHGHLWAILLREAAQIGAPLAYYPEFPVLQGITHHGARVGYRAPILLRHLGTPPNRILEIGGGHGRFIRDCALLMPETKLVLSDLPFNMIIAARYLTEYFGDQVNLCILNDQTFDPEARINIVAPWRLNELDVQVDVACNFLSFQHMDLENLNWYGDAMRKLGVGKLFQVNRAATRDPFDFALNDYPFMAEFDSAHRQVLTTATILSGTGEAQRKVDVVMDLAVRK